MVPLGENTVPVQKDRRVLSPNNVVTTVRSSCYSTKNEETADLQHRGQLRVQTTGCLPDSGC